MDKIRTYRNWVQDQGLVSFQVEIGESNLFIRAERGLNSQAKASLGSRREAIQDYIRKHPEFATTLKPHSIKDSAPEIIQEMARACSSAGVGPMAAVAGAIAEYVGRDLLKFSSEIIVENGGDIFMKTNRLRTVGIFAGKSSYSAKLALEIVPSKNSWGICTSSGTVGPSLSFGQADAATVICSSAILADAWATRLGNMVKTTGDIERTLSFVKKIPEVKGTVIIVGDRIGVQGEIKLVSS